MKTKNSKPVDVDSYIANSASEARPILYELRKVIKLTVPKVEEGMIYNVPFYNYHGQLCGFAAYEKYVSFGITGVFHNKDRKILEEKGHKTGNRTMQIKLDQKVPTIVIKQILKVQAKMNRTKE